MILDYGTVMILGVWNTSQNYNIHSICLDILVWASHWDFVDILSFFFCVMDVGVATPDIIFLANPPSASSLPLCQTCVSVSSGKMCKIALISHWFRISSVECNRILINEDGWDTQNWSQNVSHRALVVIHCWCHSTDRTVGSGSPITRYLDCVQGPAFIWF